MRRQPLLIALVALALTFGALWIWPRARAAVDLATAGTAFSAKLLCSGALFGGLEADRIRSEELEPAQGIVETEIRPDQGRVEASALFGLIRAEARRQPGLGCSLTTEGEPPLALPEVDRQGPADPSEADTPWRLAPWVSDPLPAVDADALDAALDMAFGEPDPDAPRRTRAVVVVKDGWVVAERYAPGIDPNDAQLGWSMTKSITHALVGILVGDGVLDIHEPAGLPEWSGPQDPRRQITLDQLLRMSSGLEFGEAYTDMRSDVVTMLFRAPNAGAVAAAKPLEVRPDSVWSYSSGSTNIVTRALRLALEDDTAYWRLPYDRLFGPIGMRTAVVETDPSGTFVGSSFGYASARDWARFGLLYLQDGVWGDERLLPEGWVEYGTTPTVTDPSLSYGAHWWLNAGGAWPGVPRDGFRAQGFQGQYLSVIPSKGTVLVRLGQSPGDDFDMSALEVAVLGALEPPGDGVGP